MFAKLTQFSKDSKSSAPAETFGEAGLLTSASPLGYGGNDPNAPLSPYPITFAACAPPGGGDAEVDSAVKGVKAVAQISDILLLKSKDGLDKATAAALAGISFTNPAGANYDLNIPGPLIDGSAAPASRKLANVQWVAVLGQNLKDCDITRYVTGTFTRNGVPLTTQQAGGVEAPLSTPVEYKGTKLYVAPENKYIDTQGGGIAAREIWKGPGATVVADAPGPRIDARAPLPDFTKVDYQWHFLIVVKSKATGKTLAGIAYDVTIAGQFVQGQFLDLKGNTKPPGTNEARLVLRWILK
jgi:hypothetical protein